MKSEDAARILGLEFGIGGFSFEASDALKVVSENGVVLEVERDSKSDQWLTLHCPICQLSSDFGVEFSLKLLEANLYGIETAEAVFGFNEQTEEYILFRRLHLESISESTLKKSFKDFLVTADYWTNKVANWGNENVPVQPRTKEEKNAIML